MVGGLLPELSNLTAGTNAMSKLDEKKRNKIKESADVIIQ
jgi:hypothetical protein